MTGAVIGAGQALVSSGRLHPPHWSAATAAGSGVGPMLGATLVGYRTDLGSLVVMGAVEGVLLGVAQASALPRAARIRWLWAAATPVLWAAGWTATTLAGVGVDARFTVFGATGARMVSMDNVYGYGPPGGRPFTEQTPDAATTRKGRLRGRMARDLLAAHEAGRVEVAIGRASDYFGPRGGAQPNLGDLVFPALLAGRTATVLGDPDQPHTYTFIPDIGEALALLGRHPDAPGRIWHLPNDPDTRTTRELVDLAHRATGRPGSARMRRMPTFALYAMGAVNRTVRELIEMQYEFAEPFVVDSSLVRDRLGAVATPVEEALEQTVASYRALGK